MYSLSIIILAASLSSTSGFSPISAYTSTRLQLLTNSAFQGQHPINTIQITSSCSCTVLFSSNDNDFSNENVEQGSKEPTEGEEQEPKTPTPINDGLQKQSESFTSEPAPQKRLDPLLASLTRMDEEMMNTPTTKVPILGEIPLDGSIVVLLPVALIAVVGFIMSINIAFNSKDLIVQQLDEVVGKMDDINTAMSKPPAKQSVEYDGCRGLCNNQEEQLDSMRNFMNSLAPKN